MELRKLGKTGMKVTPLCVGTSALGNFPAQYGYEVNADQAIATLKAALDGPINFIDTSNEYGNGGDSERRIGQAIAEAGGLPEGYVLATKIDPPVGSKDFSGDRVRELVNESLDRLRQDRLQLVYFHDPEKISFEEGMAKGGPVATLIDLRDRGLIGHLGVAGGPIDLMFRYLETDVFDVVLSHNRYTLVDQSADPLILACHERGVGFVNAAPFGGGMLVKGPEKQPNYCYAPASSDIVNRVREMERICSDAGIPLAAAALQFSMRDERVASTIVGMSNPRRIEQTLSLAREPIGQDLWRDLMSVARP